MRSTFKLLFYINRNKVKSDGTTAVLCRISIDGKKSAVTTGVYCKPGDWDSKKCEIKTARENNRLAAFRRTCWLVALVQLCLLAAMLASFHFFLP